MIFTILYYIEMIKLDGSEKLKKYYGKQNSEEITIKEKIKIEQNPKCTYNFNPPTNYSHSSFKWTTI